MSASGRNPDEARDRTESTTEDSGRTGSGSKDRVRVAEPHGRADGSPDDGDREETRSKSFGTITYTASAIAAVLIAAALVWFVDPSIYRSVYDAVAGSAESETPGPPPATVTATEISTAEWSSLVRSVGTVSARQGVDVTAPVAGIVSIIEFVSGQRVRAGDVLVRLDSAREAAALDVVEARLAVARRRAARDAELLDRRVVSEEVAEDSTFDVARLVAEASEAQAVIDLKTIRAPFDGTLGIRLVDLGQFIEPGDGIANLQDLSKVYLNFSIPEEEASRLAVGQTLRASFAAFPDRTFEGRISTVSPSVTIATRSLSVQAELTNEDRALLPGMFAEIELDLGQTREVLLVPQTAIAFNAYGPSVFVVSGRSEAAQDGDGAGEGAERSGPVAERRFVGVGERRGKMIEIVSGVERGTRVITSGQIKISDGSPVEISENDPLSDLSARPRIPGAGE